MHGQESVWGLRRGPGQGRVVALFHSHCRHWFLKEALGWCEPEMRESFLPPPTLHLFYSRALSMLPRESPPLCQLLPLATMAPPVQALLSLPGASALSVTWTTSNPYFHTIPQPLLHTVARAVFSKCKSDHVHRIKTPRR